MSLERDDLFKPGDKVQVIENAFSGKLGDMHNGRVGRVLKVSYGDVIFKSEDSRLPELLETYYPPSVLKKVSE